MIGFPVVAFSFCAKDLEAVTKNTLALSSTIEIERAMITILLLVESRF